ncbi:MAG: hypothetical protein K2X98_03445 [Alphaproteobacteria bacterium]|nr:hypothetical protein [Alphaproteobacteria bacterium]
MAPHIQNKSMKDIIIPGTHDSITYDIDRNSTFAKEADALQLLNTLHKFRLTPIVGKIADWSKAQGRTASQQLEDGIRYFDMRVVYRESMKKFYTCHGLYGSELSKVLRDIKTFLDNHPKEIIILDFNHLYNMVSPKVGDKNANLIDLIKATFRDKMAPSKVGPSVTLGDLWDNKWQVIVLYYNDKGGAMKESSWSKKDPLLWPSSAIRSPWPNKDKIDDLKKSLDSIMNRDRGNCFFVLQGILTPSPMTIVKSFTPFYRGIKSLKDNALIVKKLMPTWLSNWKNEHKKLNIVMMDFLEDNNMISSIINLNASHS